MTEELRELWFASAGARLFAVEGGDGPPLILLHGGLASHQACWQLAGALSGQLRLITPDLRASGRSLHAGPLGWDLLADDVAALARHVGVARAVIGGVSFGAAVATRVALRHPALTRALIVLSPAYGGTEHGLTAAQQAAMAAMAAAGSRTLTDGISALLPLFDALPDAIRTRARAIVATYDPASVAAFTRFLASGVQPFAAAELAAIRCPALVVPGADPTHPREVAEVFRAHVPACTVDDAGPGEHAAAIARFVACLPA